MLKASEIIKGYGDLSVLKGIDIHIQKGEVVSIVGASGAGKSTLLHILGTLDDADTGRLRINNQDVSLLSGKEKSKFRNTHLGLYFNFITCYQNSAPLRMFAFLVT